MTDPTLSVIIVAWNDWPKLQVCLNSIFNSELPPTEVVVIDNASVHGTRERIRERFPATRVCRNESNIGHTRAVNLGFSLARGEFILVLDSDTELTGDTVHRLLAFLRARPDVALLAPRTFNTDGTVQESARGFPGVMSGLFGRQSALTRLFPNNPFSRRYLARDFLRASEPFQVGQVGGACMFFRRKLLDEVGAWDERYFGYWVDTDWCRELAVRGKTVYCLPDAHITHHEGNRRGNRKTASRIWMFHYGAYQYYTKWHTAGYCDPRSLLAFAALSTRSLLKTAMNNLTVPTAARAQSESKPRQQGEVRQAEYRGTRP